MQLNFKTKLSYGVGGISDNTLYTLTGTYLLLYLTTVAGVNAAAAGTICALGTIWEAIIGPIIGFKSDNTISKFGRRKPFILVAAFPVAIVTSMLFTAIDASPTVKVLYYGLMIVLFWTFFSMEFVPYLSWGADLTEDYHERTVLRSYAYVFNQVGMLIGMVLPTIIVDYLMNLGRTREFSWQAVGILSGLCAMAALLICALSIKKDDKKNFVKPENFEKVSVIKEFPKMFREYKDILKLKPILFIFGASMVYLIANTIFSSGRVFYMTYNLGMDEKIISMMMLIITISGVAFVPFLTGLSKKFDKKNVFMYSIGGMGVIMVLCRFLGVESLTSCIILCLVYSLANTAYWQLMPSIIYDVCEVDELVSGRQRSGSVISLQAMSESISIALGTELMGIILDLSGFAETQMVQPDSALFWTSNCFTLIPGIFMIGVIFFIKKYPINKQVFAEIMEILEKRRNGEEVDDSSVRKYLE